ncbi:MAG: glycosyltransferase, partial [Candidatus Yanofskybacteria bacterium]|nr:glycosyltransferase [Candidatus Yanofskybacteria bacterium]
RNPNILNDIASLFELKKIIKEFGPDTLFLNSSKAGFNGSLAVKISPDNWPRPRIIYRIGGWTFNDPWPWWKRLAYRLLEKISAPWKDYIIVNNKHDYEQAVKYRIKPRKEVVLIHNGIDPYKLRLLDKDEAKIRLYESLPPSQKHASFLHESLTIGTIANFYPAKGLEYLIEAFRILTYNLRRPSEALREGGKPITYNLVLIGDGPERENIESRIKNLELGNKIILAGRIHDAYKYLPAFDIFVLPSVKEGFPWALLEAMSAKLPIIATTVGANPEIIENKKNGLLVPPANPQALAKAIVKLAENEALRHELSIQAHQTVLHKFDLRKMIEQVEKLI